MVSMSYHGRWVEESKAYKLVKFSTVNQWMLAGSTSLSDQTKSINYGTKHFKTNVRMTLTKHI